jgi:hypothetical protein
VRVRKVSRRVEGKEKIWKGRGGSEKHFISGVKGIREKTEITL